jgi:hypothetical protein
MKFRVTQIRPPGLAADGFLIDGDRYAGTAPESARTWDAALAIDADVLESEAMRCTMYGHEEPVFYQEQQVGSVRKRSDVLPDVCNRVPDAGHWCPTTSRLWAWTGTRWHRWA